ncbi:LysR family transcriptional regulator [Microbispora rosea subsp. aerata]|nr:LysR family transcriptional regulator [Microbispora rosea]GGO12593.1 LysR family transcriptional regulator [Microbispora rosea subsp. aerata]GIH54091.1 LysR family transcriptional regulator [Microbispora rosea subsp. aerata]GLJ85064.1 LysR family transcriptional regulator [Microbispora rosea subsp. aerata]
MSHRKADASAAVAGGRAAGGPLDLMLLRTFLAVYRAGSFTAAAALLGLSQPTVTSQVRTLEEQLDRQLFERLPRGVAATSVAHELAARVAGPLDELAVVAGRGRMGDRPSEPVHLGGPAEMLSVLALPALAPLVEQGLRLRVTAGLADDLLEGLRAGRFDLVVSAIRPRGRTVVATPLMDEEFVLVAAPVWADRIGPVGRDDPGPLHDAPLVAYAEDVPILRRYWRHVFRTRLTRSPVVVVPDLRGVLAAVAAGAGITVLPRYLCAGELDTGELVMLLDPDDPPINTCFLAQRAGVPERCQVALVRDRLLREARHW